LACLLRRHAANGAHAPKSRLTDTEPSTDRAEGPDIWTPPRRKFAKAAMPDARPSCMIFVSIGCLRGGRDDEKFIVQSAGAVCCGIDAGGGGAAGAAELIVGSASMPRSLANPLGDGSHSGRWKFQLAFDPVTYGTSTGTQPGLGVAWKNTSPTTWELKVRKDAVFHDGKPLHSSDIADLINWLNTKEGKAKGINTLRNMSNIIAARTMAYLRDEEFPAVRNLGT